MEECIDGSRPPPVDRIVYELSERIQSIIDEHPELNKDDGNVTLEIEGRLGCITDPQTRERIKLPIENEVMMSSECKHAFQAGVSEKQFQLLKAKFKEIFNLDFHFKPSTNEETVTVTSDTKPKGKNCSLQTTEIPHIKILNLNTHDEFRSVEELERPLRFSYSLPRQSGAAPLEIIRKENVLVWTLFTGTDREEDEYASGDRRDLQYRMLDFRIAVNLEYSVDFRSVKNICLNNKNIILERKRERVSYCSKLFRIDTTTVCTATAETTKGRAAGNTAPTYEVEVELNPKIIIDIFTAQKNSNSTSANNNMVKMCDTFVGVLRDFCAFLNADASEGIKEAKNITKEFGGGHLADLAKAAPPIEKVHALVKHVAKKPPLLGDYIYRAVLPMVEKKNNRIGIYATHHPNEEEFSLYTHSNAVLSGPWGTQ